MDSGRPPWAAGELYILQLFNFIGTDWTHREMSAIIKVEGYCFDGMTF